MPSYTRNELDRRRRVRKERLTLARRIAAASGEEVGVAIKFLDALAQLTSEMLHERGAFLIHNIVKLRMKSQSARAQSFKNICGRMVPLCARPQRDVVACGATRGFTAALKQR